jgi:hypothetical protein
MWKKATNQRGFHMHRFLLVPFIFILSLFFAQALPAAETKKHPEARDYFAALKSNQKNDIRYIINTLANNSGLSLLFKKSSLERAGNRTGSIHPLAYLAFMFSDSEIKGQVKYIGNTAWQRFVSSFGRSLSNSVKRNNMTDEMIKDFCEKTGISVKDAKPLIDNEKWWKLMDLLIDHVD